MAAALCGEPPAKPYPPLLCTLPPACIPRHKYVAVSSFYCSGLSANFVFVSACVWGGALLYQSFCEWYTPSSLAEDTAITNHKLSVYMYSY